jgi:hypothetical protein
MGRTVKSVLGQKFGRLTVQGLSPERSERGEALWLCLCECSQSAVVVGGSLRRGKARSCGCLARELRRRSRIARNTTHGLSDTYTQLLLQRSI